MKIIDTMDSIKQFAAAFLAISFIVMLTACSNSSDPEPTPIPMPNNTENSAEIIDPSSILASLEFDSATDQATYQCLLSATTSTATSEGMQAFPVFWDDSPVGNRGSFQTWCKTSGSGVLVDQDIAYCATASVGALTAPGTRVLSIDTRHFSAGGPVGTISHYSKQIPETGEVGWLFSFSKSISAAMPNQDRLNINFQRFDGNQLVDEAGLLQHPYVYRDSAIDLLEFVRTDRTINEYLTDYRGSTSQFNSTINAYLTNVLISIEGAIQNKTELSEADISAALQRARTEIDQTKAFFNLHGDELHSLLLTSETYIDCE